MRSDMYILKIEHTGGVDLWQIDLRPDRCIREVCVTDEHDVWVAWGPHGQIGAECAREWAESYSYVNKNNITVLTPEEYFLEML